MFRRMLTWIMAGMILMCVSLSASASQTGSIRIATTGGTVALYKVGDINGQNVCLYETYGGGILTEDDLLSANLAAWLNERAQNGHIKAADILGDAVFENLSSGLYLIAQPSTPSGQTPFEPFLLIMPWDGYVWDVNIDMEILPQTGSSGLPDVWVWSMLASAVGIGACFLCRKRVAV